MSRAFAIALTALFSLAACDRPGSVPNAGPREPDRSAIGFYCRMNLAEHQGPKGQVLLKDWKEPLWFSSVRDALTYIDNDIVSERELVGFWVNDMGRGTWEKPETGAWVSARDAWYVVGSSKSSGMGGGEAVPFRDRAAADTFSKEFGGSVADYVSARKAMAETGGPEATGGSGT